MQQPASPSHRQFAGRIAFYIRVPTPARHPAEPNTKSLRHSAQERKNVAILPPTKYLSRQRASTRAPPTSAWKQSTPATIPAKVTPTEHVCTGDNGAAVYGDACDIPASACLPACLPLRERAWVTSPLSYRTTPLHPAPTTRVEGEKAREERRHALEGQTAWKARKKSTSDQPLSPQRGQASANVTQHLSGQSRLSKGQNRSNV